MAEQVGRKLNQLGRLLPEGLLVDAAWLSQRGYSTSLRSQYVAAGWLAQPTRQVYQRPRGSLSWQQVVISLQTLLERRRALRPGTKRLCSLSCPRKEGGTSLRSKAAPVLAQQSAPRGTVRLPQQRAPVSEWRHTSQRQRASTFPQHPRHSKRFATDRPRRRAVGTVGMATHALIARASRAGTPGPVARPRELRPGR